MAAKAADFLVYDKAAGVYRENPEQAVINGAGQTAQKIFAPSETQERKLLA